MDFDALSDSVVGLCNRVLGKSVSYTPYGGTATTIDAVFSNEYVEVEGVSSLKPVIRIRLSDLNSEPAKGDQVLIDDITFNVMSSHPDTFGGSTLILKKA